MNKIFLRTGAWYSSETPALSDDLELSALLKNPITATPKETVVCNCKNEIEELHKRIDDLTKVVNKNNEITWVTEKVEEVKDDKPASIPAKKSVPKKPVAKKSAAKKK